MIVYVVTTLTSKGKRIEGVFEDRRQAAYLCAVKDEPETRIEEWDTNGMKFSGTRELLSRWNASIDQDGMLKFMMESFTFRAEADTFDDCGDGVWAVTMITEYGLTEQQTYTEILERFENWRIARP